MTRKELAAQYAEKQDAVKALADKGLDDLTAEEAAALEGLIADRDAVKAELDRFPSADSVKARVDAGAAFLKTAVAPAPLPGAGQKGAVKATRIDPGESEADKSKSLADYLKCVGVVGSRHTPTSALVEASERLEKVYDAGFKSWDGIKAALSEQTGITGGYTAPPTYSTELLRAAIEDTVFASRARQIPMTSAETHIPALNQTSAPTAGQTAFTGGMVASWTGEAATRSETEPTFKQVTLRANELSGYTVASRNILADSGTTLEAILQMLISDTVQWYIDYGCLQGNGVAKPLGVLNAPATVSVTRATSTTIKLADALGMMAKLMPSSRKNAIWIAAIDTLPQIGTLLNSAGNPTYLPQVGTGYGQAGFDGSLPLLGRPVYFTEKLPALGTAGDLMLVDPSYYLVGQRMQLEIAASDAPGFTKNQMYWRFVARMDGQPWIDAPFTLQDGTRTVSPFVKLV